MSYERNDRIRRAAILVASLDEALAEQMLASLPPQDAAKVAAEVDRLEDVELQEQADVLAEFRSITRRGRAAGDGVEFTYSAPLVRDLERNATGQTSAVVDASAPKEPSAPLVESDVAAMAELLVYEHPQTIAAALSRLGHDEGAAVFAALPAHIQPEVLDRIATLESADEDALSEVQSQLLRRIDERRQRRDQAAAGAELARRIVARTSAAEQSVLLGRLSKGSAAAQTMATTLQPPATAEAPRHFEVNRESQGDVAEGIVSQQAQDLASAVRLARHGAVSNAYTAVDDGDAGAYSAPVAMEDLASALEALPDDALLAALQNAEEQVVHRALAASSEAFLRRVTGKLSWRQARGLRRRLRAMGPTRLVDLRRAQEELLRIGNRHRSPHRGERSAELRRSASANWTADAAA